ncbi:hypothetical protein ABK040_005351 [Willaertia magna]
MSSSTTKALDPSFQLLQQSFLPIFQKVELVITNYESIKSELSEKTITEEQDDEEEQEWGEFVPLFKKNKESNNSQQQQGNNNNYKTAEDIHKEIKKKITSLIRITSEIEFNSNFEEIYYQNHLLIVELLVTLLNNNLKVITTQKGGQLDELKRLTGSLLYVKKLEEENIQEEEEDETTIKGTTKELKEEEKKKRKEKEYLNTFYNSFQQFKSLLTPTHNNNNCWITDRSKALEICYLKAFISCLLCSFEHFQQSSYLQLFINICNVLHFLMNECYLFLNNDPREILYNKNNVVNEDLLRNLKFNEGLGDVKPMVFCKLYKIYSYMLQRLLTITFNFTIQLDILLIIKILQEGFLLQPLTLQFTDKFNTIKSIFYKKNEIQLNSNQLKSNFYSNIFPTIHSENLKILTCLIMNCKDEFLPYLNSICEILVTETRNWKISLMIALSDYSNCDNYVEVYKELMRCLSILISIHNVKVIENCTQKVISYLLEVLISFQQFINHHIYILPLTSSQQQANVENYENILKKKKRKKSSSSSTDDDVLEIGMDAFPTFLKIAYITIQTLKYFYNDSSSFITMNSNASSGSNKQDKTMMVDTISLTVDLIQLIILFTEKWNELFIFFKTNSISITSAAQVKYFHQELIPIVKGMYELLLPTLLSVSCVHTQSPFLPHVLMILRKGLATNISEFMSVCQNGLNIVDSYLHPRSAPLYTPSAESIRSLSSANSLLAKSANGNNSGSSSFGNSSLPSRFFSKLNDQSAMSEDSSDDEEEKVVEEKKAVNVEGPTTEVVQPVVVEEKVKSKEEKEEENPKKRDLKPSNLLDKIKNRKQRKVEAEPKEEKVEEKKQVSKQPVIEKKKEEKKEQNKKESKQVTTKAAVTSSSNTPVKKKEEKKSLSEEEIEEAMQKNSGLSDDEEDNEDIDIVDDDEIGDINGLELQF